MENHEQGLCMDDTIGLDMVLDLGLYRGMSTTGKDGSDFYTPILLDPDSHHSCTVWLDGGDDTGDRSVDASSFRTT